MVPASRIRALNDRPIRPAGEFIVYWMIANRRMAWNYSLDRAIEHARSLDRPLVILEALRCGYRWASDRLHRFVLQGFAENRARCEGTPLLYHAYVEPEAGHGKGLVRALGERACVVVTDDFPAFMLPHMTAAAARQLTVRLEAVDSNGLWPMRATQRVFTTAASFRLHLQRNLGKHLEESPRADPLRRLRLPELRELPREITRRWPMASDELLRGEGLARLPIDHAVAPAELDGSARAAQRRWRDFLDRKLSLYAEGRNHPDDDGSSGLSPWLHFGRISVHQLFHDLAAREGWSPERLGRKAGGRRAGWWGMSPEAEAFLDELVTWRELGFNLCALRDDYDSYESLPRWALETLAAHTKDRRAQLYSLEELAAARTGDEVWNAAQRQLLREGRIHNYLRMLWGKRILEWTRTPEEALRGLIELNNRYALDGRDPNSYSGIFWVLGRYDRAWGPERPIFGKVRYMSSANTLRKLRMREYLRRFSAG